MFFTWVAMSNDHYVLMNVYSFTSFIDQMNKILTCLFEISFSFSFLTWVAMNNDHYVLAECIELNMLCVSIRAWTLLFLIGPIRCQINSNMITLIHFITYINKNSYGNKGAFCLTKKEQKQIFFFIFVFFNFLYFSYFIAKIGSLREAEMITLGPCGLRCAPCSRCARISPRTLPVKNQLNKVCEWIRCGD